MKDVNCRPGAGWLNAVGQHGVARYSDRVPYMGIQVVPRNHIFRPEPFGLGLF